VVKIKSHESQRKTHTHAHTILTAIFQVDLDKPVIPLTIRDIEASSFMGGEALPLTQQTALNTEGLMDVSFDRSMPSLPPNRVCALKAKSKRKKEIFFTILCGIFPKFLFYIQHNYSI